MELSKKQKRSSLLPKTFSGVKFGKNLQIIGLSSLSRELVWLWGIVPDNTIIEHIIALIVKVTTIIEYKRKPGSQFA